MPDDSLTVEDMLVALQEAVHTYEERTKLKVHPLVIHARNDDADSSDAVDQALDDWIEEAADEIRDAVIQLGKAEEPAGGKGKH